MRQQPELLDHRLPAGLDLVGPAVGGIALGQCDRDVGLGPRRGDPRVRQVLVHPGELARVGAARCLAPTEQHADRQAGGQGEDREQCGGHAGIVTHGTDRTLEPTPSAQGHL